MNAVISMLLVVLGCPALLIFLAWLSQRKTKPGFQDDDDDPVMQAVVARAFQSGNMVIANRRDDGTVEIEEIPLDDDSISDHK